MNRVPQHLLTEDRADYERLVDEALRSAPHRPELAAIGQRLNPAQLRTMALNATALVTVAAASEYQHYVRVREERRSAQPSSDDEVWWVVGDEAPETDPGLGRRTVAAVLGAGRAGGVRPGPADRQRWADLPLGRRLLAALLGVRGRPAAPTARVPSRLPAAHARLGARDESDGAGLGAVLAVLTPVLAGTAAVIFLLVGYLLNVLVPTASIAVPLLTTGWVFAAITAASILVGGTALLLTALREARAPTTQHDPADDEVARAREVWHEALLERGILPFLREALAAPGMSASRIPQSPGPGSLQHVVRTFPDAESSPGEPGRPRYASPDFTSPDFGGPEHERE
ncbi:hypothetical protein ACWCPF_35365 [Streptomyces sp. NPDC001858]